MKEPVAAEEDVVNALWRPDKARSIRPSWPDYVEAMKSVDKAIVFNIAWDPRTEFVDIGGGQFPTPEVNNVTSEL
ncbi:MAG: hypothetical protein R2839_13180, partial [Thermomicrobiales bacterium]